MRNYISPQRRRGNTEKHQGTPNKKLCVALCYLCVSVVSLTLFSTRLYAQSPPIYVTLWFDTEDYILPQSDDAAKRLAEMLTRMGIKATFKVVGEKARVLEQRGRKDVIAALKKHEIGYHSNYHSMHPTPAEYLQNAGWDDGVAEFYRREISGVKDIQRIFGVLPSCYGQPGSSWGPQSHAALKQMGINVYLDDSNHVGIGEQPFYFGGILNIFKMRSNLCRMELNGEDNVAKGKAKFTAAYEKLKANGGGTISIYYHPCEWVHQEFWDGVNFSRGANPEHKDWKLPRVKPAAEMEKAYQDFEEYMKFIKTQAGVRWVTANELKELYADSAMSMNFSKSELRILSQSVQKEISFLQLENFALSPAEMFFLLTEAAAQSLAGNAAPQVKIQSLTGPTHMFMPSIGARKLMQVNRAAFATAIRDTANFCHTRKHIPNEVWIGSDAISPADFLASLGRFVESAITQINQPEFVEIKQANFTADKYVAVDEPRLWSWVIYPEGFHAPKIMEMARLQAWTLKPAIMKK